MDDVDIGNVVIRLDGVRSHVTFYLLKLLNNSGF